MIGTAAGTRVSGSTPDRVRVWERFGERLEKVIARLDEDHALIIQEKGSNRYVQFVGLGAHGLRAEAVANAYLTTSEKHSPAQVESLLALGWIAPTGTPAEATPALQPEGSPNFMRQYPTPVEAQQVADLAVATLADVMRIPHPGFLCYQGRNLDTGDSLVWNDLELKLAEPRHTLAEVAQRLLATLQAETGNDALDFDKDGDIGLRHGSVMVFVRAVGNTPSIRIHAPILLEVPSSPELLEKLNDLNSRIVRPSLFHIGECVYAMADLPATPYEAQHVVRALSEFCTLADGIDELLQGEFGGRTAFSDGIVSTTVH